MTVRRASATTLPTTSVAGPGRGLVLRLGTRRPPQPAGPARPSSRPDRAAATRSGCAPRS
ncbi:hypothetical protein [Motilibacter deserti]|uniref:Uncharacterized protein n=1 Tax=Motilibacter deserti TaxID=2714956 RepID=A0ABX0GYR1_9ACTN|nr:hypothetical protein [Motilibacter deserti]NHC14919.1 hypothetical protein [Motilibacter deserti]